MAKNTKAHTATVNRIARRYNVPPDHSGDGPDIQTTDMTIEVETTATLAAGIAKLNHQGGAVYVAVTNREALREALRLTENTPIGVMDPQGNIIRKSGS